MAIYRDPVIKALMDKFNAEGPEQLKGRYYYGDPIRVPKSVLPAVFLTKEETRLGAADNMNDQHTMKVNINLSIDITKDWGKAVDMASSHNQAAEWLEGRDENLDLKTDSLAYIVRKYQTLIGGRTWINLSEDTLIDYVVGAGIRGEGADAFTLEAILRINLTHHQQKP